MGRKLRDDTGMQTEQCGTYRYVQLCTADVLLEHIRTGDTLVSWWRKSKQQLSHRNKIKGSIRKIHIHASHARKSFPKLSILHIMH